LLFFCFLNLLSNLRVAVILEVHSVQRLISALLLLLLVNNIAVEIENKIRINQWWEVIIYSLFLAAASRACAFSLFLITAWAFEPIIPPPHLFLSATLSLNNNLTFATNCSNFAWSSFLVSVKAKTEVVFFMN